MPITNFKEKKIPDRYVMEKCNLYSLVYKTLWVTITLNSKWDLQHMLLNFFPQNTKPDCRMAEAGQTDLFIVKIKGTLV